MSTPSSTVVACEACGWAAAFCSMLAFGSFGVSIKSKTAVALDIDPLVFQSYKTFMCFMTSWLVLIMPHGPPLTYTPWGIVSGLFWVPGGIATVYAVKKAGLAIGIGIGSSFIVLVSFIWGILIFEEKVHSRGAASLAIACMMSGLFGMSYFSSPESPPSSTIASATASSSPTAHLGGTTRAPPTLSTTLPELGGTVGDSAASSSPRRRSSKLAYDAIENSDNDDDENDATGLGAISRKLQLTDRTQQTNSSDESNIEIVGERDSVLAAISRRDSIHDESDEFVDDYDDHHADDDVSTSSSSSPHHGTTIRMVHLCNGSIQLTERQCGMLAAVFCGTWGGSIMAPMKFCQSDTKGVAYLISFAIGASIVNIMLWILRYIYLYTKTQSWHAAYQALPSFHVRILWLAGGTCGLLWSIGNFFSLISVYYLGEGVGYPLVQTAILVSGLWGIFYFKEVQGVERITKWFLSSLLTVFGILLLGYEHHEKR